MAQTDRRELGETDGPMEDELELAFDKQVGEGVQRLHRSWREVLATGLLGGIDVGVGVLAYVAVRDATGDPLLAGLAFSVGFLALLLGRGELFTEGFLIPVVTVAAGRASRGQLARLWSGTLVANLAGGWLIMALVVVAYPELHGQLLESGAHFAEEPLSARTAALSLLGGAAITLMTRMQHGTDAMVGKIAAAVAGAFVLAGLELFHSVLDSLLVFGALQTGEAPFGYLEWLGWFAYTAVGNVLGGLVLVTLIRLVRSKERLEIERDRVRSGD